MLSKKSFYLHLLTVLLFLTVGILVVVFAMSDDINLTETGNVVIGSIIIGLSLLSMVPIFMKKPEQYKD